MIPRPAEPDPPPELVVLQEAFVRAVRTPFRFTADGVEPRIEDYPPEVLAELASVMGHHGVQRLLVYNKQYWFRLISVLQQELPLLRRMLGLRDFNRMAMAFLEAHPSRSYSLNALTRGLPEFVASSPEWGGESARQATLLECTIVSVFDAGEVPPLDPRGLDPTSALGFQPHLRLFREDWNLVVSRREAAAAPDDDSPLTPRAERGWWAIYRWRERIQTRPLDVIQHRLLELLAAGGSLVDAVGDTSAALDSVDRVAFEADVGGWFAEWAALGWFADAR